MFFKTKNKNRGEDLNRKVEKYRKWWQDQPAASSFERSGSPEKKKPKERPFDSSFVYHEDG
jgi:hypothetical protein